MVEKKSTPTFVAIVPARGGSKRFKKKNIALLDGKPLVCWSIEAAKKSRYIDRCILSTDDPQIAKVAKECGAEVPFMRPSHLGSDTAGSEQVVEHALKHIIESGFKPDFIVLLQPTSPLRRADHIDEAIETAMKNGASAVISVTKAEHSPLWYGTLPKDGSMDSFLNPDIFGKRSQDLPSYYRINGAIYLIKTETFLKEGTLFPKRGTYAYIMEQEASIDIDTVTDLYCAEAIMKAKKQKA